MNKKYATIGTIIIVAVIAGGLSVSTSGNPERGDNLESEEKTDTITVTDMTGREVEVPKKVDEIVGLEAGALRLITYLNSTDKIVGVEQFEKDDQIGRPYIYAHPELSELPSIGPQHGGDPEQIVAQEPDVIFWTYATAGDAEDLQQKTGIPVIALEYGDLGAHRETVYEGLRTMGKVLGKEKRAEEVIQYIRSTIQDLEKRTEDIPSERKPEAYVGGVCYRGSHGIIGTEPKYAPFQFVNAKNPADNLGTEHAMVSSEKLVHDWNPDIIFVDEGSHSLVMDDLKEPEFKSLKAVQNENIYGVLPQSYYTHNFGTVLADSYFVGNILYPEKFDDINPEEKADEIYEELVGEPVYDNIEIDFGGFKNIKPPE